MAYDPETGLLTWLHSGPGIRAGMRAGAVDSEGYRVLTFDRKTYRAHRIIWYFVHGDWPTQQVDHVNGDRDDNRLCNLRLATPSQNMWNSCRPKNNTSGVKGVSWSEQYRKWQASIKVNRRSVALGSFDNKEEAAEAYQAAALIYHGEFARFE